VGRIFLLLLAAAALYGQARTPAAREIPRGASRRHYVAQFQQAPGGEVRRQLAARGFQVTASLPGGGLVVTAPQTVEAGDLDAAWLAEIPVEDKLSPLLDQGGTGAFLVEFHADVSPDRARQIAENAGLDLLSHPDLLPTQLLVTGALSRVTELASWDEVAYVFPASSDLVAGARVVACGGALLDGGVMAPYVKMGTGWPETSGGEVELHYLFTAMTGKLPVSTIQSEILRAFEEWARYAPLRFTPAASSQAARTISILFARGSHGDAYPFDGPGKILAHTFYPAPPNAEPIAGDMHLDEDEDWQVGRNIDLFTVVLHETGHALGLAHSDQPGAIMYPYYRLGAVLSDDDIAGIRNLYGSRDASSPGTPAVTPPAAPADPGTPNPATPGSPGAPTPTPGSGSDTTPPALRITSPALTIVSTSAPSITVRGTASDNAGVTQVAWSTSNGDSGTAMGTAVWSASVPLEKGTNTVTIRAFDPAGNPSWRAITVVRR
jgi:hypothetical protein